MRWVWTNHQTHGCGSRQISAATQQDLWAEGHWQASSTVQKGLGKGCSRGVEKRAIGRDDQWKKHLADTRVEMERRIEDRDWEWENHLESRLCEQVEWQKVSRVQMECMVKDSTNTELRRLEEQVATMRVRQISWYLNCCLHQTQWRTPGGTKQEEQVRQW